MRHTTFYSKKKLLLRYRGNKLKWKLYCATVKSSHCFQYLCNTCNKKFIIFAEIERQAFHQPDQYCGYCNSCESVLYFCMSECV